MDKILKRVVVCLLVAVAVCLGLVSYLLSTMPERTSPLEIEEICILNILDTNGNTKCGNEDIKKILHKYMEKMVATTFDKRQTTKGQRTQLKFRKRLLKLVGTEEPNINKDDKDDGMTIITSWEFDKELDDNSWLKYKEGHVTVPVDGHYFVTSHIEISVPVPSYRLPGTSNAKEEVSNPIKHGIYHRSSQSEKDDTEIVSAQHVVSNLSSSTSHLSSLVDMRAGDELSVKISNVTFLRSSRNNSFEVKLI